MLLVRLPSCKCLRLNLKWVSQQLRFWCWHRLLGTRASITKRNGFLANEAWENLKCQDPISRLSNYLVGQTWPDLIGYLANVGHTLTAGRALGRISTVREPIRHDPCRIWHQKRVWIPIRLHATVIAIGRLVGKVRFILECRFSHTPEHAGNPCKITRATFVSFLYQKRPSHIKLLDSYLTHS